MMSPEVLAALGAGASSPTTVSTAVPAERASAVSCLTSVAEPTLLGASDSSTASAVAVGLTLVSDGSHVSSNSSTVTSKYLAQRLVSRSVSSYLRKVDVTSFESD